MVSILHGLNYVLYRIQYTVISRYSSALFINLVRDLPMNRIQVILNPQILATRLTPRVKVRRLTDPNSTVSAALADAVIVECCGVEDAAVIPDRCAVRYLTRYIYG